MKFLGPSWKTSVGGYLTILAGVATTATNAIRNGGVTAEDIGLLMTAITAGLGLISAKDRNVSNAPAPIPVAQPVDTPK